MKNIINIGIRLIKVFTLDKIPEISMKKYILVLFFIFSSSAFANSYALWGGSQTYPNKSRYDLSNMKINQEISVMRQTVPVTNTDDTSSSTSATHLYCMRSRPSYRGDRVYSSGNPDYVFTFYAMNKPFYCDNRSSPYYTNISGHPYTVNISFELKLKKVGDTQNKTRLTFPAFSMCMESMSGCFRAKYWQSIPWYPNEIDEYWRPQYLYADIVVPTYACEAILTDHNGQVSPDGKFSLQEVDRWAQEGTPPNYSGSSFQIRPDNSDGCSHFSKTVLDFDFPQTISRSGDYIVKSNSDDYGFILRESNGENVSNGYHKTLNGLSNLSFFFNYYLLNTNNPKGGKITSKPINISVTYQ